jgi:hypothetical protein
MHMKKYLIIILLSGIVMGGGYVMLQKKPIQESAQKEISTAFGAGVNKETKGDVGTSTKQAKLEHNAPYTESVKNNNKKEEKKIEAKKPEQQKEDTAQVDISKAPKELSQEELLAVLQLTGKNAQYEKFADYLAEVYARYPTGDKEFVKAESEIYVRASDYLDKEKNAQKALDVANIVYKKVPFGWRFKYLKVRAMEALGRAAFTKGDVGKAEEYARTILRIEYRPEGANLLADIYIKKIETMLAQEDMSGALELYEEIQAYQVGTDQKTRLDALAVKLQRI